MQPYTITLLDPRTNFRVTYVINAENRFQAEDIALKKGTDDTGIEIFDTLEIRQGEIVMSRG